jgi:hypothetical protein
MRLGIPGPSPPPPGFASSIERLAAPRGGSSACSATGGHDVESGALSGQPVMNPMLGLASTRRSPVVTTDPTVSRGWLRRHA